MLFPSISDYKDAIALSESFATLTHLTPEKGLFGDVYFSSGNFAVVFKMRDSRDGALKAVKCFTREQDRRVESLDSISHYLGAVNSPFIVPYTFLNDEIWVNDAEYPVLLMDWVEGVTLGEKVKTLCEARDTEGLHRLSVAFAALAIWLLEHEWAHGDLKHDNIIVRPNDSLVLVDYDGCFVPTMTGQAAREIGSPCYRHPNRTAAHFDRHIDDFSILVIFLSLRALVNAPELLMQHHNGENMVLTTADFDSNTPLTAECRNSNDPILRGAIALLDFAVAMPSQQVFGLKEGVLMPFFEEFKQNALPHKVILRCKNVDGEDVVFEVERDVISLYLHEKQLTSLPPEIGQLTRLTSLSLKGNQLTDLPTEIWQLVNLTWLNLSDNQITSLPVGIGQLTKLTSLYLGGNQLTSLPTEIAKLTRLTRLNLKGNQLTDLPTEIWQLVNLTLLNLSDNQLTNLPVRIIGLESLRLLNLRGTQITSLPHHIWQLTNLTLSVNTHQIELWVNRLQEFKHLKLDLSHNDLTSLPFEIVRLSNLTSLNLRHNKLTSFPLEIIHLNLTSLDLRDNQLTCLPANIGQLTNLRSLNLVNNQLASLPVEIGQLTNLTLGLDIDQVIGLLPSIQKIANLKLDLGHNNLTVLPSEIGHLTNLISLDLGFNKLTSLPAEIGHLTNLISLDLWFNKLASLPAEIGQLRNLKTLVLLSNNFTEEEEKRIERLLPNCEVSGDFHKRLKKSLLKEEILTMGMGRSLFKELEHFFIDKPKPIRLIDIDQIIDTRFPY